MRPAVSRFPDPRRAPADAPLAWGGDLEPATLIDAYTSGIFPWPAGGELYWWSPDPRAVFPLDGLHVSRSLRRTMRRGIFSCSADRDFVAVVQGCADRPEGTWVVPSLQAAYRRLHRLGLAHSVEVWDAAGRLVGGVYGVTVGGAFCGESMFSRVSDASKVALVHLVGLLRAAGFVLFDAQLPTPHLLSMGAVQVPRDDYLEALDAALAVDALFPASPPSATAGQQPSTGTPG